MKPKSTGQKIKFKRHMVQKSNTLRNPSEKRCPLSHHVFAVKSYHRRNHLRFTGTHRTTPKPMKTRRMLFHPSKGELPSSILEISSQTGATHDPDPSTELRPTSHTFFFVWTLFNIEIHRASTRSRLTQESQTFTYLFNTWNRGKISSATTSNPF